MPPTAAPVPTIADVLPRLEALLGPRASEPRSLQGGITNRNFLVTFAGEEYVVRLPGADTELLGIRRDSERFAAEGAAALGLSPVLVASLPECSVTRYVACEPATPEQLAADPEPLARMLRTFHRRGPRLPSRFAVAELLDRYGRLVTERGHTPPPAYGEAKALVKQISQAVRHGPRRRPVPCHNDLLAGNVLCAAAPAEPHDRQFLLVDWEYAGMGEAFFDLGNLAVNNGFDPAAEERLLHAYLERAPADRDRARLRLMRLVSDAREAAWGVVQQAISDLDFDFAAYAHEHFERLQAGAAHADFAEWLRELQA